METVRQVAVTDIYYRNQNSTAKIVVNEGGGGSGKSHSIAQVLIERFTSQKNKNFLITRKTFPSLRLSAMKLVVDLLTDYDYYRKCAHHHTEHTLRLGSNLMYFGSLDDPEKIKSTEWDYIWSEEASDFTWKDFVQFKMRLTRVPTDHKAQIFLSYNPMDEQGWYNNELKMEEDIEYIHSTYLDNPFRSREFERVLEGLKDQDPEAYKIYALGLYGKTEGLIFPKVNIVDGMPKDYRRVGYGLDFGFTHPTALYEVGLSDGQLWLDEKIYAPGLRATELFYEAKQIIDIRDETIADSSSPMTIAELQSMGWNLVKAIKGPDSVKLGIDIMKRYPINITRRSAGIIKEQKCYKWATDKNGNSLGKPVDAFNDAWDSVRYVVLNKIGDTAGKILRIGIT